MAITFDNPKEYIAELIGTAIIMTVGVLVGSITGVYGGTMMTGFAFAVTFIGLVYLIGSICDCHFNPLVSLSMFINKRMNGNDLFWYILAQVIGGILGCIFAFYLATQIGHTDTVGYYASLYGIDCLKLNEWNTYDNIEVVGAFLIEMLLAFLLCFIALKTTDSKKISMKSGIIIGFTTFALIYLLGGFTYSAINPAKSIGAAIAILFDDIIGRAHALEQLWLFLVAPVLGAVIAAFTYMVVNSEEYDINEMLANAKAKSAARKEAKAAEKAAAEAAAAEAAEQSSEESEAEEIVEETVEVSEESEEEPVEEDLGEVPEIETETVSEEKTE